jgi:hypothetical protein
MTFNGVKVFSTTSGQRSALGEAVTGWLATHPTFRVVDFVISQSSDVGFQLISICVFYRDFCSELGQAAKAVGGN